MTTAAKSVLLVQSSETQELLLRETLASQGVPVAIVAPYAHLETEIIRALRGQPDCLLVVLDLGALAQLATSPAAIALWVREHCPGAKLMFTCGNLISVRPEERAWARKLCALDLLPGCARIDWQQHLAPVARALLAALGIESLDTARLERALAALPAGRASAGAAAQICAKHSRLAELGVSAPALIAKMRGETGVAVKDRAYHATSYSECFVGSEAVDWITSETGLAREAAVEVGQILLDTGAAYHVAREQLFRDGYFFYQFAADTPRLAALDLDELLRRLRAPSGVAIKDRSFHGVAFPACFVGAEAVDWLVNAAGLSLNEAMTLGQRLIDLYLLHHVTDEHGFKDGYYFYRFYEDESSK